MIDAIFISDLHLTIDKVHLHSAFANFMTTVARTTEKLYILGDFFDFWVGDDGILPFHQKIIQLLEDYAQHYGKIFFMPGNRDFAIGADFLKQTHMYPLEDPCVIKINSTYLLLMHGDLLCTEDEQYQRYRKIIRNPLLMRTLRLLPVSWRQMLARSIRKESQQKKEQEEIRIMDVSLAAVISFMHKYNTQILIHGHTHRPGVHEVTLPNNIAGKRYVLGDWDKKGWYIQSSNNELKLVNFPIEF